MTPPPRAHAQRSEPADAAGPSEDHAFCAGATARASSPVLVLALDGASWDVIRPLAAAGKLPNLARWMEEGAARPLRSTLPPVTFPAWSSFMTGLEPGRHGIFDFTQKEAGAYRLRFVNASDRRGRSLFARVCEAGGRVLVLGMPAAFPPEPLRGLLVSGFDAPVSSGTDERSANDPALYRAVAERAGPWMRPDLDESARAGDFHERAVGVLLDRIERKQGFALEALRQLREQADGRRPELAMIVFSESDTVGHHYWRDHDVNSPRHDPRASDERKTAIARVYQALDRACGELHRAYGEDALCVVLSDHGMGSSAREVVHLNRFLEERGLLARRAPFAAGAADAWARRARDTALRVLPRALAQALFRRARGAAGRVESAARFGGFDWASTQAFSEEANTQPGVWINLRGREAQGCVEPGHYEDVRQQLIDALHDWKLPDGEPVVARARRREDVYEGPFVERAPDVVVELALHHGHGLSLVATPWHDPARGAVHRLADDELAGGRGRGMNGTHRPDGVLITSRQMAGGDAGDHPRLAQVAPLLLAHMGIRWNADASESAPVPAVDYDDEQTALVDARLRALGYLE